MNVHDIFSGIIHGFFNHGSLKLPSVMLYFEKKESFFRCIVLPKMPCLFLILKWGCFYPAMDNYILNNIFKINGY